MIVVVFSDGAKGAMLQAKENHLLASKDILLIGFHLDIGDITKAVDSKERQAIFKQLYHHTVIEESEDEINAFFATQRNDMDKLLDAARHGEHIRMWKSREPYTLCGFYYVCAMLKDTNCTLSVITLPELWARQDETYIDFATWNAVSFDYIPQFLSLEIRLSKLEKTIYGDKWQQLMDENTALRTVVNGQLISVSEDFYDYFIQRYIPSNDFQMFDVIAQLCGYMQLGVPDGWYALRILKMIKEKRLKIVKDDKKKLFGKILRKV